MVSWGTRKEFLEQGIGLRGLTEIQQHARRSYLLDGLECFVFGCL